MTRKFFLGMIAGATLMFLAALIAAAIAISPPPYRTTPVNNWYCSGPTWACHRVA